MLKQLLTFIGLAAFSTGAFAQTNQFSLQDCIDYAVANNRVLKNAKIDAEIANSKVWETVAAGLPQVNANAQLQHFIEIPTSLIPAQFFGGPPGTYAPVQFGVANNLSLGLDASMIVFDGSYLAGLQASSTYKKLSLRLADRTEVDTRVAVTKAYYNVLLNTERLEMLKANITRLEKLMSDVKAIYENGLSEKIDYDRVQLSYNNLQVDFKKFTELVGLGALGLKMQMGMPLTDSLVLTDKLDKKGLKLSLERIDSVSYEQRPDYNALMMSNKLYKLDYKRAKLSYLPSIIAFASTSRNAMNNDFGDLFSTTAYPTTLVGLKATMPIFGSFKKYQQLKQARLSLTKSDNDLESVKTGIVLEAKMAQINYNSAVLGVEAQQKNMELAKEVLRVTKAKYDQGMGSSLEVVIAEADLKIAETNYIAALSDALSARVDMDKAQGLIK